MSQRCEATISIVDETHRCVLSDEHDVDGGQPHESDELASLDGHPYWIEWV
jgi:hypothetical protein